jgi:hypothetical protein
VVGAVGEEQRQLEDEGLMEERQEEIRRMKKVEAKVGGERRKEKVREAVGR